MNKILYILILFQFGFLYSCGPSSLSSQDYISWCKDYTNGLHKSKEVNGVFFDVQYKPFEMILASEFLKKGTMFSDYENDLQYIELSIHRADGIDITKYNVQNEQMLNDQLYYYSFAFQQDLFIEEEGERYPCVLYHYERSYNLKSVSSFVLGFKKSALNTQNDKVLIVDSDKLGSGPVRIKLAKESFKNIPVLKRS